MGAKVGSQVGMQWADNVCTHCKRCVGMEACEPPGCACLALGYYPNPLNETAERRKGGIRCEKGVARAELEPVPSVKIEGPCEEAQGRQEDSGSQAAERAPCVFSDLGNRTTRGWGCDESSGSDGGLWEGGDGTRGQGKASAGRS